MYTVVTVIKTIKFNIKIKTKIMKKLFKMFCGIEMSFHDQLLNFGSDILTPQEHEALLRTGVVKYRFLM